MEKETTKEVKVITLPDKVVIVKPIIRNGGLLPDDHDGKFMYTRTFRWYTTPVSKANKIINPLTPEEQKTLEIAFGLAEGEMSKDGNKFFANREVALDKNGVELHLNNPEDYLYWKILLSNTDKIAPSWDERFSKGTYKFALVDTKVETKKTSEAVQLRIKATNALGKISTHKQKMIDAIMVYRISVRDYTKLPLTIDKDSLYVILDDIINKDAKGFLDILDDKDYEIKLLVQKLIIEGLAVINPMQGNRYQIKDTDLLGYPADLVRLLKDPINEATKARLIMIIKEKDVVE